MIRPGSEAELAEAIRGAAGPLEIAGGGTRPAGRRPGRVRLETGGLSGVRLYEPEAMTLVAGAGTPLAQIEALLAAEGQRLPFEPWGAPGSTIGGVVATNASGPRRVQAGAARDSLIGVRFVDGTGAVVKNGGRVMKNVTGYDLVKLMAGSHGTLGVLTEVSFRVLAAPPARATLARPCAPEAAPALLARALGSPFDVTGAAWAEGQALVRVEGLPDSVAYRAGALARLLGAEAIAHDPWPAIARGPQGEGVLWSFSIRPSEAPGVIARLAPRPGGPLMLDWGGGRVRVRLPEGEDGRALARPYSGHATRHGPGPHAFEPRPAAIARLEAGLRARFDPRGILEPGRMD